MRKFLNNYRFVAILVVIVLLGTVTVYALARRNLDRSQYVSVKWNPRPRTESSLRVKKGSDEKEVPGGPTAEASPSENRTITYRGVSFAYGGTLASEVKAETESAYSLQYETDTGEGVAPEHIVFKLVGDYASKHESSTFSPKIIIYPIADYKKTLVKSEKYVRQFEAKIQRLKRILSEQPHSWENEIPFLPFAVGASQGFHARLKYVNFRNGKGILFLTQYNIETALINNQGLTYAFQGLTNDGAHYVSATFPVSLAILPQSYDAERTEDYKLVPRSFRGRDYGSFEAGYRMYLTKVIEKLEKSAPDNYQPTLAAVENLIRSLDVAWH